MQYINYRNLALLGLLISLLGCNSEEVEPIKPESWIDDEGSAMANDVFIKFNGTHYKSATEIHSYSASIKNRVVEGRFEVYNFGLQGEPVSDVQGDVICIVFEDDCKTARVIGIITSGSDPAYLDDYAIWTVVDDGMNINETTDIRYPVDKATADYHCSAGVSLEWFDFDSYFSCDGKAQVRSKNCN